MHLRTNVVSATALALALGLTACGTTTGGAGTRTSTSPAPTNASPVHRVPPAPWAWTTVAPHMAVATTDHSYVSFLWMDPAYLRFRFVPGYRWPEKSPRTAADKQAATWTGRVLAAFNGGFKLHDGVGGYYYLGHEVAPLLDGQASLVTYADGSMRIGAWNRDLRMTKDVVAVRQNLRPFIDGGTIQATPNDPPKTWGVTIHRTPFANRTLLGVLKDGSYVFEFAHRATPIMLAREALKVGVQFAIVLDMNGIWPTGFVYTHTGTHLIGMKINPNIERMPKLYMRPTDKDFIAVLAPASSAPLDTAATAPYAGAKAYTLQ